jgi:hypothetical protein
VKTIFAINQEKFAKVQPIVAQLINKLKNSLEEEKTK